MRALTVDNPWFTPNPRIGSFRTQLRKETFLPPKQHLATQKRCPPLDTQGIAIFSNKPLPHVHKSPEHTTPAPAHTNKRLSNQVV